MDAVTILTTYKYNAVSFNIILIGSMDVKSPAKYYLDNEEKTSLKSCQF